MLALLSLRSLRRRRRGNKKFGANGAVDAFYAVKPPADGYTLFHDPPHRLGHQLGARPGEKGQGQACGNFLWFGRHRPFPPSRYRSACPVLTRLGIRNKYGHGPAQASDADTFISSIFEIRQASPYLPDTKYKSSTRDAIVRSRDSSDTNPGSSLFRLNPDFSCRRMDSGIILSNGMAFSPDDKTLVVGDSRSETIWRIDGATFDATVGASSGCPLAANKGAAGSACTEDPVFMRQEVGIKTGITLFLVDRHNPGVQVEKTGIRMMRGPLAPGPMQRVLDLPLTRFFRHPWHSQIGEESNEIQRVLIARKLLKG